MSYIKIFLIILYTIICSIFASIFALIDPTYNLYVILSDIYGKGVLFISGIKLRVTGLENFDKRGTYVFVSNHSSQYDIPAMQAATPNRIGFVFKKELAKIPVFGWQLLNSPNIIIDRQNPEKALKSIDKAKEKMEKKNISPIIFAEGTRSKTGEVQPFKRGAFYLAARVGFPIVPVSISGTYKIMPKGKFKIKSGIAHIHFGKPVETIEIKNRNDEIELMNKVREMIISNLKND